MGRTMLYAALALGLGASCGDGGDDRDDPAAGPIGSHEDSGVGAAPSAGSPAPPASLLPGTCGVLRRVTVPQDFSQAVRVPDAFVIVDDYAVSVESPAWRVVADDGARQETFTATTTQSARIALLPLGADAFAGSAVLLSWGDSSTDGMDELVTEVVHADAAASPPQLVGVAFRRGTAVQSHALSLDGLRAVFASGHVATDDPHALLIDATGQRVGNAVDLIDSDDGPVFDCLATTSTEHAGAVSVTDATTIPFTWQLVELTRDGSVAQRVTLDATEIAGCPHVQLTAEGLVVVVLERSGHVQAYLARDGLLSPLELGLRLLRPDSLPLWVGQLDRGRWLALQVTMDGHTQLGGRADDGSFQAVAGQVPTLRAVLPAEPGRLFAIEATDELVPAHRELLELGCAPQE